MEFALVAAAMAAVIVAFGALWRLFSGGLLVEHALSSASHHVGSGLAFAAADVLLY